MEDAAAELTRGLHRVEHYTTRVVDYQGLPRQHQRWSSHCHNLLRQSGPDVDRGRYNKVFRPTQAAAAAGVACAGGSLGT